MSTLFALVAVFGWFWLVLAVNEHLKRHPHVHNKSRGEHLHG